MPGLSRLDVVKQIRTKRSAAALPIIIVSACTDQTIIVECLQAGANDYETKAVDFQIISAHLASKLGILDTYRAALGDRSKHIGLAEESRVRLAEAEAKIASLTGNGQAGQSPLALIVVPHTCAIQKLQPAFSFPHISWVEWGFECPTGHIQNIGGLGEARQRAA